MSSSNLELIARHLTAAELEAGLDEIRRAPKDEGTLELIVRRPKVDEREVLDAAELTLEAGLVGDSWITRGSSRTPDGSAHPDMQLNIMNSRVTALVAQHQDRWQLAGDQLYLDLDLSEENLPAGSRFAIGAAMIEVSPQPHLGCRKFVSRFGLEAMQFVNSPLGRQLRLRGINARVVSAGVIRVGDVVRKIA
jgi:MOSC domain-containing protein